MDENPLDLQRLLRLLHERLLQDRQSEVLVNLDWRIDEEFFVLPIDSTSASVQALQKAVPPEHQATLQKLLWDATTAMDTVLCSILKEFPEGRALWGE